MPRRSNDFQDLVALIQRGLADQGAIITDSALVSDSANDGREIDVLIETMAGPYRIRIAVEAKDEGRPMDSTKFESIIGKYFGEGGVKVNKVVVVTHRGFYQPVIDRARLLDVDLFTLTEAKEFDWSHLRPPGPCLKSKVSLENIVVRPTVDLPSGQSELGRIVCTCGRNYGSLSQFAQYLFWKTVAPTKNELLTALDDEVSTTSKQRRAHVALDLPHNHTAELVTPQAMAKVDGLEFDVVLSKPESPDPNFIPQVQFRLTPHVCRIEAEPPLPVQVTKQFQRDARLVCTCCGKDHGSLIEWSHDLMFRRILPNRPELSAQFEERMKAEPNGQAQLTLHWPFCKRWRIRFGNQEFVTDTLLITVHAGLGTGRLECKQYDFTSADGNARRVSHFDAHVAGKRLQLLMPDGLASNKIVLRIDDSPEGKRAIKKRRNAVLRESKRSKGKKRSPK